MSEQMPPIGVTPYYIVAWSRIKDLAEAITRESLGVTRDEKTVERWANEITWQCTMIDALKKK